MRIVIMTLGLAAFWMALSGFLKPLLIAFGVLSVALTVWLSVRMRTADEEGVPLQVLPGAIVYLPWLFWEIVKSSWNVAKVVIDPRLPISPTMITVNASQKTDVGLAIYANSITLTPGTVTTRIDGNTLTVHALVRENADDVASGEMDRRARRFEGS